MGFSNEDKIKIRTAVKCYLKFKDKATAKELYYFIAGLDLKIRCRLTPNILAKDLTYCCKSTTRNFLNIDFYKNKTNTQIYYLRK